LAAGVLGIGIPAAIWIGRYKPPSLTDTAQIIGDNRVVILEPEKWAGKPFPLLKHIDIGSQLSQGQWVVVLFHHDCAVCQRVIPAYEQMLDARVDTLSVRAAIVEVPPYDEDTLASVALRERLSVGRLDATRDWFVQTPVELFLEDGRVTRVTDRVEEMLPERGRAAAASEAHWQ
jgi:hypothetical protein